jgi:hypothetical protein
VSAKTGKSRRAKGSAGEREFFKALSGLLGETVTRDLSQTRDGGADGRIGGWRIEVKRQEKARLHPWWEQACAQAPAPALPALAYRASRMPWRVVVALESIAPDAAHFAGGRECGFPWTAEISLDAFAALVREAACAPENGVLPVDPPPTMGAAENRPKTAPDAAEAGDAKGRGKLKRQKARLDADRGRVEKVLQAYGAAGLESRQIALIVELESAYVTRLLVTLRDLGRVESRMGDEDKVHRWWTSAAAPPAPARKWARDVPLANLDADHQQWTRETLRPKPKYDPVRGAR